jgi:hypothetical protein
MRDEDETPEQYRARMERKEHDDELKAETYQENTSLYGPNE